VLIFCVPRADSERKGILPGSGENLLRRGLPGTTELHLRHLQFLRNVLDGLGWVVSNYLSADVFLSAVWSWYSFICHSPFLISGHRSYSEERPHNSSCCSRLQVCSLFTGKVYSQQNADTSYI